MRARTASQLATRVLPEASCQIHAASYFKRCDCTVADEQYSGFGLHPSGGIAYSIVRLRVKPLLSFGSQLTDEHGATLATCGVRGVRHAGQRLLRRRCCLATLFLCTTAEIDDGCNAYVIGTSH